MSLTGTPVDSRNDDASSSAVPDDSVITLSNGLAAVCESSRSRNTGVGLFLDAQLRIGPDTSGV
jgi:hypothetical protein